MAVGEKFADNDHRVLIAGIIATFVVLNPILLLMHGYHWNATRFESSAILIYLMKLTPFVFLLAAAYALKIEGVFRSLQTMVVLPMAVVWALSAVAPVFFDPPPSLFYFAADAVGLAATFAYFLVTRQLLLDGRFSDLRHQIFRILITGAAVTSVFIIVIYFWNFEKVSIPPDIHYGIAIAILMYLIAPPMDRRLWIIPFLIIAGIGAAQLRINFLVAILCIGAGWFFAIFLSGRVGLSGLTLRTTMVLFVLIAPFLTPVVGMVQRLSPETLIVSQEALDNPAPRTRENVGVDQRYVEVELVFAEMAREPLSYLTGKGFGATFENVNGIFVDKDDRIHSVHNSVVAVWLRNGLLGVALFLIPAALAVITCFQRRSRDLYVASVGLLMIYLACLTDQYVYWGGYFGIALAIWAQAWREARQQATASA